ncbi:gamma-glutamyltransferase [Phenylobacterium parvum]|uniref:Glutathione hydrolase proenzyme n=1 Tax=Phenylobacterium parvum TaxID=2201350 RepID=A0A2Z3HPW9_9CAUL|nr:gamma-glutamyltransferase [Phenylobacterium parvum]AWM78413.1 gamma-glutamyltransferase [Phenylobacterium parvum]
MRPFPLLKSALLSAAVLALVLPASPVLAREAKAPAAAPAAKAKETGMVAAAHPLAVEAGVSVLRRGGSAVDAAVAVQAALGLVEPQSSGIGGGAFITYYDAKTRKVTAYNGRETAPAGASPDMFLGPDGKPLSFVAAVTSGRSTGVPGAVAMLHMAQKAHGRLAWKDLFTEAEALADQGFAVTPRLAALAASRAPQARQPDAVAYFTKPDGQLIQAGDILRNPAYAATLRKIAAEGPAALLEGEIAEAIVRRTTEGPLPGTLTLADLKAYKPKVSEAVCRPYRVYVVCVPPAPSGGPAVLMGLGILANTDIAAHGPDTVQGWYLFSQASRLMYADRDRYFGDPDFVDVPVKGLLDPAYLKARAALIPPQVAGAPPPPGKPKGAGARAPDATQEPGGTTHFVIVDGDGNVVSMTTTVESLFGSGRMVHGFFLNNQLTDFSFSPTEKDGVAAANAVAPGKRPRSSMAPAVVLDRKGRFYAAVGSPGGNSILAYNLKALVGVLDWKLSMQEAVALPNLISRGAPYLSEPAKFAPGVVEGLAARGVVLVGSGGAEGSGLHGVMVTPQGLSGGADPRREGVARKP